MRKLLFLILFQLISFTAGAAVFVVTSNADSGPGTLRQALLDAAANGSAEKDYINFNIADQGVAGRTIILISELPDLSSNLIIDASTQAGTLFGDSDAKVEIATPINNNKFTVFNGTGLANVEFYALYIHDYSDAGTSRPALGPRYGVRISNSSNIIYGSPGKGNLINGFNGFTLSFDAVNLLKIQSNIIGLTVQNGITNTEDSGYSQGSAEININNCDNIFLGGDNGFGNVIFTTIFINFLESTTGNITIGSNNLEVLKDGKTFAPGYSQGIGYFVIGTTYKNSGQSVPKLSANAATINLDVKNNVFDNLGTVFRMAYLNGKMNFFSNYFGIARDQQTVFNTAYASNLAGNCIIIQSVGAKINIGNNDPANRNFFYYMRSAVTATDVPDIEMMYNEFKCINSTPYLNTQYANQGAFTYIQTAISVNSVNTTMSKTTVNGTASPNADIQLYSSENCSATCSLRSYLQSTKADSQGNWTADILNLNGVFYASATLNNRTSVFKTFEINSTNVNIQPMRCTNVATITGLVVPQGLSYYWTDYSGNIVSHDLDLITTKTGDYRLVLGEGCITSDWFKIEDKRVTVYDGFATKTMPACGTNNGSVKNLFVYDPLSKISTQTWTNSAGVALGSKADLSGLAPDIYILTIKTTDGCTTTYVMNMSPTTGPNINQTNANITPTNCGQSVGSITNITATGTGTLKYNWKNAQNQQVATTKELTGQPAGVYTLQVSDDTNCGPVYTSAITIPEVNGIIMDETAVTQTPITCAGSLATVSGIKVTGATIYQWFNNQGLVVGNAADLSTGSPGNYRLVVSNANGCNQTSKVYTIIQQTNTDAYGGLSKVLKDATCDLNNGSIQVLFTDNPAVLPKSYRWVNHSSGITVATTTTPILTGIDAGAYDIYATNSTGCERMLITYSIGRIPGLTVLGTTAQVTDDQCGTATGSIKGVGASGKTPLSFVWTDNKGAVVGTAIDLLKVKAGNYHLKVSDGSGCEQTLVYTIRNQNNILPAPVVSNLQLCGSGDAILSVSNPSASLSYRLYDAYTSEMPIDEQVFGRFKINVKQGRSYYVSQFVGECESERIEVKITVGLSTINIANTFSPNGDGINDTWNITNIQNYPNGNVQIFTRAGQKVFESIGYSIPFDGRYNGKNLPMGTYYYIINLNSGCGLLSGSLTLIR